MKYACDSGGPWWDFEVAASVTGYAYMADVVIGAIGILVSWFLMPTFYIDTTDLAAARKALDDYQAQIIRFRLLYNLPLSLLGILWKSYLGGLGAHFGTEEKCSLRKGVAVFLVLGLTGLLLSFVI